MEKKIKRINKGQSEHIDKIKKNVKANFKKLQIKSKAIEKALLNMIHDINERLCSDLTKLLGVTDRDLALSIANIDYDGYDQVMKDITELKDACIIFGGYNERRIQFNSLREMWMKGAISVQQYVLEYLKVNKIPMTKKNIASALEYLDLSFGVGEDKDIVFGKGIKEKTKKQYRTTLIARKERRKIKRVI